MAECLYYSSKDIEEILGIGKHKANDILHMFDQQGKLFKEGKTLRVRKTYFHEWLNQKDGDERRKEVVDGLFQQNTRRRKR